MIASQQTTELTERFIRAAEEVETTVEIIPFTPDRIYRAVDQAVRGKTRLILARPDILPKSCVAPLMDSGRFLLEPDASQLESAEVGITDAFAGVARTGSVCVAVTSNLAASASLFAEEHIVLLEIDRIVLEPRDVFVLPGDEIDRRLENFVYITGPSATADMGALVYGVHGPGKLHIMLLAQEQ